MTVGQGGMPFGQGRCAETDESLSSPSSCERAAVCRGRLPSHRLYLTKSKALAAQARQLGAGGTPGAAATGRRLLPLLPGPSGLRPGGDVPWSLGAFVHRTQTPCRSHPNVSVGSMLLRGNARIFFGQFLTPKLNLIGPKRESLSTSMAPQAELVHKSCRRGATLRSCAQVSSLWVKVRRPQGKELPF